MTGRGEERLVVMWHMAARPQTVIAMGSLSRGTGFLHCNSIRAGRKSCAFVDFVEGMIMSGARINILMRNGREM